MSALNFIDRYTSTLASSYTSGGSSLSVASATGLPSDGAVNFYLIVKAESSNTEEVFHVTSKSGTTLTVSGAQANTSASNHSSGATVIASIHTKFIFQSKGCMVRRSTNQSVSNNTDTLISFDSSAIQDDGTYYSNGTPTRVTVPSYYGGWYIITANVRWDNFTGGLLFVHIKKNGNFMDWSTAIGTIANAAMSCSVVAYLADADYLELDVFQSSGSSRNVVDAYFSLALIC